MINYRYNILEKLGEGGSGEVFLAEDTRRKNMQVAIKILHSVEKSGMESDEAFQNEVSALVNLSHPNLVRIVDFGTIRHVEQSGLEARRFFTMEFIRGVDSLEWMSSIRNQTEKSSLLEMLLLQALSALSYVHHEGVIHFDIKPQNLVLVGEKGVTATPLLKLTDFGFSKKADDSFDVPIRGTLEYTAPELLRGEAYDHRIDLYSLGATFYHLLEGRCPFEAQEPVELAKRILTEEVAFTAATSSHLREVIRALMQRDPAHRFPSAEDAALALEANIPQGKEMFESYFGVSRKPKFVGRKSELETIGDAVSSLVRKGGSGKPSAFVVSGGEGIGKTALLKEVSKSARARELPVYETESVQTDVPFEGVGALLDLMGSDARSFSDRGRALFEKYDQLIGFSREESPRFEAWGRQRENVVELMSRFIIECSDLFSLVIVADDVHLLDESSVSVLRTTIRDVERGQLLLLAAETSGKANVFPSTIAHELNLRELAVEEVSEMSTSVLGAGSVADEIGLRIYGLYGGTPGIIVEAFNAVSALVPSEALRDPVLAKEHIAALESRLPHNINDFLVARFQKLSRERQLILSMLSCFQFPARTAILVQLLPFHSARSADHIRFLQLDGFIGTVENESSLFIRMRRLRDAVYETITVERHELHGLIASTLEQDVRLPDFTLLQELAFQFSECESYEKASIYYEKAADEGIRLFALQRALQLYRDAIAAAKLTGEAERTCALEVKYASALFRAGSYREAIGLGRELTQRQQIKPPEKIVLFKIIGLSSSRLGENEQAREHIHLVLHLSANEIERLELRQELVGLQITAGHFKEAEKESREQLAQAEELKIGRLVAAICTDLGIATFFQDRFDYAAECFTDALQTYEALNEKMQVINSMNNIGNALSAKGDFPQAIAIWEKALKTSQEFGTLNQQAQIQNNLGIAHYNLKKYDRAKQFYSDARMKYDRIGSQIGLAQALTNLGEVLFAEGEYEAALNRWKEAKVLYSVMTNAHALTESCLHIANVFSRLGHASSMKTHLDEAEKLIENNALDTFRGKYHFLRGICHLKDGEFEHAEKSLGTAVALYKEDKAKESLWLSTIRLAECLVQQGKHEEAVSMVLEVLSDSEATNLVQVMAEADYFLGTIAMIKPQVVREKPIVYFKHGIDSIAKEPVSETTWKLAFALAREYYERGQRERAKEFLVKTKLILQFFLSHFTSPELKKQYLEVDQKERVFATIDAITKK